MCLPGAALINSYLPPLWPSSRYNLPTLKLITSIARQTLAAVAADDYTTHKFALQYSLPLAAWAEAAAHDSSSSFPQALAVALASTSSSYCASPDDVKSWLECLRSALPASDDDDDDGSDGDSDDEGEGDSSSSSRMVPICIKPLTVEDAHTVRGGGVAQKAYYMVSSKTVLLSSTFF
jgi:hypothetical protein